MKDVVKINKKLELLVRYQQAVQQEQRNFLTMAGAVLLSFERTNSQLSTVAHQLATHIKEKKTGAVSTACTDLSKSNRASLASSSALLNPSLCSSLPADQLTTSLLENARNMASMLADMVEQVGWGLRVVLSAVSIVSCNCPLLVPLIPAGVMMDADGSMAAIYEMVFAMLLSLLSHYTQRVQPATANTSNSHSNTSNIILDQAEQVAQLLQHKESPLLHVSGSWEALLRQFNGLFDRWFIVVIGVIEDDDVFGPRKPGFISRLQRTGCTRLNESVGCGL